MIPLAAAALPAGTNWGTIILAVVTLFGGGSIVAFARLRKEGPRIIVEAAQGAVVVQSSVIDDLQEEIERAKAQIAELRGELSEALKLQRRVRELEHREEELAAENTRLRSQVRDMQGRITDLEKLNGTP